MKTRDLTVRERIHCVQTVFRLLTGLGSALHSDPSNFCDKLYELLMLLPTPGMYCLLYVTITSVINFRYFTFLSSGKCFPNIP